MSEIEHLLHAIMNTQL